MLGTVLSLAGVDVKRQVERRVRQIVITTVLAAVGAIMLALALGFGIALLYAWLELKYGAMPALAILAGGWAVLGIVLLGIAFLRPTRRRRVNVAPAVNLKNPAVAIAQATEQAVDSASNLVREGSRQHVLGAIVVAALAGFLIGRRL